MRVLLATDGSRYARAAARFLARFVPGEGKHVDVMTVVPKAKRSSHRSYGRSVALRDQWRGEGAERVATTANTLRDRGFIVQTRVDMGAADRRIVEQCGRVAYDLVVAGATGRGGTPYFGVGSVARALLEQVPTSVLLVREREPGKREKQVTRAIRPLRVLVATDGRPHSQDAIDHFMQVLREPHAEILVVSVREAAEAVPAAAHAARGTEHGAWVGVHEAANRLAPLHATIITHVLEGEPASSIVTDAAENDVDLIVLGSRGLPRQPSDSVAVRVAHSSPCSVLVVRGN